MKTAVILGGSSGLGLELTRQAIEHGIIPLVLGRKAPADLNAAFINVDLSDERSVVRFETRVSSWWPFWDQTPEYEYPRFFVWNAGMFEKSPLTEMRYFEELINVNYRNGLRVFRACLKEAKRLQQPLHLIAISSTASLRAHPDEAVYAGTKAAQAQVSRSLSFELLRDLPESKVVVVLPDGMKTNLYRISPTDTSGFLDPKGVAEIIWAETLKQRVDFDEFQINNVDQKPVVNRKKEPPHPSAE